MSGTFPYKTPSDYLNKLRTLFYTMVGLPMFVFLGVYLTNRKNEYPILFAEPAAWLMGTVAVLCLLPAIYAYVLYYGELKKLRKLPSLREKLDGLYRLNLKKFWILETVTVLNLSVYVLSAHPAMAGLYVVMLVSFAMSNPSYYNVVSDLRLPKPERDIMRNNRQIE